MIKQPEVLIRLQSVSNELRKLHIDKEYRFNDINKNKKLIQEKKNKLTAKENDIKAAQIKINNKELDLKGFEDAITKFKIQLNQVKTNKEFSTLQHEIKLKEADKSVFEDDILKMMNDIEEMKKAIKTTQNEIKIAESELDGFIKAVEVDVKKVDDEIKSVEEKKNSLLGTLETQGRQHFERLIKNKDGIAVANVINNVCKSCNYTVTAQTINLLLAGNEIVFCNSCGRMLYLNSEEYVFKK